MSEAIILSEDEKYFAAHITDLSVQCRKQGVPKFSCFLTPRELAIAREVLMGEDCFVFGGAEETERGVIGIFTDTYACFEEDKRGYFPIKAVTYTYRKQDTLSHRDFLGCILSLGVKRELLGDIFVGEGFTVVFLSETILGMLKEIDKVGNVGVAAAEGITHGLPERKYERIDGVVSSTRLDCIVAMITNSSREKTSQLIKSGLVQLDGVECTETSINICTNRVLSVRGSGKFKIAEIGTPTKKNRLHITVLKYI